MYKLRLTTTWGPHPFEPRYEVIGSVRTEEDAIKAIGAECERYYPGRWKQNKGTLQFIHQLGRPGDPVIAYISITDDGDNWSI